MGLRRVLNADTDQESISGIAGEEASMKDLPRDSMVSVSLTDHETAYESKTSSTIDTLDSLAYLKNAQTQGAGGGAMDQRSVASETISLHDGDVTESRSKGERSNKYRHRSGSMDSDSSTEVDWEGLDKTEEQEPRDMGSDESTALLLAQLEQANNALARDPKSELKVNDRAKRCSRPPSIQQLKKLVNEPHRHSLRLSSIPSPPPMTELEFWAALVKDFPQTAQRLPTLTSNKLHNGVPPPLRGVVWLSMAGARDEHLQEQYDKLSGAQSPYENMIGKDIGRSFPGVELFRDPDGEGQKMLANVLKCFSLYDKQIGYCQGLGFLVGPLLMQMSDREAFCVLVRLMDHYDLRSCFLPDLSGLHLRIFQFQRLLSQHLPTLAEHLNSLGVEATYLSQWFLSFFAVTCPLPMLFRIYDVIFAEGASETLMRVALSVMRRNAEKLTSFTEFEDVLQLLLSRALWDPYNCNADDLVRDFVGFTGVVTRESLQSLETSFKEAQEDSSSKIGFLPDVQAAASKFLGRLWAPSNSSTKSNSLSPGSAHARPGSFLRRTASKQSIASTLNSVSGTTERSVSIAETVITEPAIASADDDCLSMRSTSDSLTANVRIRVSHQDSDLHGQIEDLLTALSELQREHAVLAAELEKEREDREEDQNTIRPLVQLLKAQTPHMQFKNHRRRATYSFDSSSGRLACLHQAEYLPHLLDHVNERILTKPTSVRVSLSFDSRQNLRQSLVRQKEQLGFEVSRNVELSRQLDAQEQEARMAKGELKEARTRLLDASRDKQRLERALQDLRAELRARPSSRSSSSGEISPLFSRSEGLDAQSGSASITSTGNVAGLREFKLGRPSSGRRIQSQQQAQPAWGRRSSSLIMNSLPTSSDSARQPTVAETSTLAEDLALNEKDAESEKEENASLLAELVTSKTAEAIARQELEEMRGRYDALKRLLGVASPGSPPPAVAGQFGGVKTAEVNGTAGVAGGGWGWGWGKRSVSSGVVSPPS